MTALTALYIIIALLVAALAFLLLLPKTRSLRITGNVALPPEAIFATVTDLGKAPQWIPTCTSAVKTDGRDGAARKQKVTFQDNGATRSEEQQVTTWVDNRQYGWKLLRSSGALADARTVLTLTKQGEATEVEILGEWTAASLFSKIPAAFAQPNRFRAQYEGMISLLQVRK